MSDHQAPGVPAPPTTASSRYPVRGRGGLWAVAAVPTVICLLAALPGLYAALFVGYALFYAGPVIGAVVIVGGALRRHSIRRQLLATGAGLDLATPGVPSPPAAAVPRAALGGSAHASSSPLADTAARDDASISDPSTASGRVAVDRDPSNDGRDPSRPSESDRRTTAGEAADFRLARQPTLLVTYAVIAATGIAAVIAAAADASSIAFLFLAPLAFLGLTAACIAPGWALARGVVVGEEHALLTRTGGWRLIRALRILALAVGVTASLLAAYAAITTPLSGSGLPWSF